MKGQILQPASWTHEVEATDTPGEFDLVFNAEIHPDWYLYSSDFDPDCGPIVASFSFTPSGNYALVGELRAIDPIEKFDDIFECDVRIFKKEGQFRQTIRLIKDGENIQSEYEYQVCSDITGQCINFSEDFEFVGLTGAIESEETEIQTETEREPEVATPQTAPPIQAVEEQPIVENTSEKDTTSQATSPLLQQDQAPIEGPTLDYSLFEDEEGQPEKKSLLGFMILAFLAGLAALFTPCVFPMIPMTVTFFTSKGGTSKALIYGISIVVIYTIIGAAVAPLMGPDTANHLSTQWLPNVIFFAIFVVFALSFFGLFDINIPTGFVNKMDKKADKGGLTGVFFMAFTLVLVSFSCTGPIVGSILVASAGGEFFKPIMGMFAFSMAFAIPFTLFAIFPQWLSSLPKSGGWLNSVKVVLGFIELALAFKFLSIADQAYHWGILDRDLNIAIWVVIFTLMGFYLLGKIRLPHDSKLENIPVPRFILAIITFTFVIYLLPGLWGAPLKALAGYLPPMYTHDFDLISLSQPHEDYEGGTCEEAKYADFLHLPHGIKGYFDYEEAMSCARAQNKPLFIDFTGHGCTNCREMEANVWSDPAVLQRLKEDFVVVALYVDDKTELPESEWYTSSYDQKVKKTLGRQNADLQIRRLNNNAQPFYVLVGADENVLVPPLGYERDVSDFIEYLDKGKTIYAERFRP